MLCGWYWDREGQGAIGVAIVRGEGAVWVLSARVSPTLVAASLLASLSSQAVLDVIAL